MFICIGANMVSVDLGHMRIISIYVSPNSDIDPVLSEGSGYQAGGLAWWSDYSMRFQRQVTRFHRRPVERQGPSICRVGSREVLRVGKY